MRPMMLVVLPVTREAILNTTSTHMKYLEILRHISHIMLITPLAYDDVVNTYSRFL
jgi:hypothetical protein